MNLLLIKNAESLKKLTYIKLSVSICSPHLKNRSLYPILVGNSLFSFIHQGTALLTTLNIQMIYIRDNSMILRTQFYTAIFIFVSFFISHVQAQDKPLELYIVNFPPYMIIEGDDFSGIDIEVTQAAFAKMGIQTKILAAPWKRVLKNLEHGRIAGAITCSKNTNRLSFMDYSDEVSQANRVAVMSKTTDDSSLKNFEDLNKFKVVALTDWGTQKELTRKGITHNTTLEMDNGIKSVVYRGIDVFYNSELPTLYRARQLNLLDKIKTKRLADKTSTSFYLCLSKKFTANTDLIEKFNIGLAKIRASGEVAAIQEKYL
jgi:polar amino acid transport system substrate-binding protein